jgi:hypothetical protein
MLFLLWTFKRKNLLVVISTLDYQKVNAFIKPDQFYINIFTIGTVSVYLKKMFVICVSFRRYI